MIDAVEPTADAAVQAGAPTMSPFARAVAVFVRPAGAWEGLREHAQWWFPMLVMVVVGLASALLLHHRALVPTMIESWEEQAANGQMDQSQMDGMIEFFESPAGVAVTAVQQVIATPLVLLVVALVIWFGVGFVLGTRLRFRHALEVAAWSNLVTIPTYVITTFLAWSRESMRGIHIGLGALLPAMDEPTKLGVGLRSFLDALGPLAIWYLVVGIIGAAALSGAPRRSVAWVLGVLYVALAAFMSGLAAVFTPGT
jgi:hypothetical protein